MNTWGYVAIGAVVLVGGYLYLNRGSAGSAPERPMPEQSSGTNPLSDIIGAVSAVSETVSGLTQTQARAASGGSTPKTATTYLATSYDTKTASK